MCERACARQEKENTKRKKEKERQNGIERDTVSKDWRKKAVSWSGFAAAVPLLHGITVSE